MGRFKLGLNYMPRFAAQCAVAVVDCVHDIKYYKF
jgi:hypothetical protein